MHVERFKLNYLTVDQPNVANVFSNPDGYLYSYSTINPLIITEYERPQYTARRSSTIDHVANKIKWLNESINVQRLVKNFVENEKQPMLVRINNSHYYAHEPLIKSNQLLIILNRKSSVFLHCQYLNFNSNNPIYQHQEDTSYAKQHVEIPLKFKGWFEIVSEDGFNVSSTRSLLHLVKNKVRLIVNHSEITASLVDSNQPVKIAAGAEIRVLHKYLLRNQQLLSTSIIRCQVDVASTNINQIEYDKENQMLKVFIPLNCMSKFSQIAVNHNISGLHRIENIFSYFRFPVNVHLVIDDSTSTSESGRQAGQCKYFRVFNAYPIHYLSAVSFTSNSPVYLIPYFQEEYGTDIVLPGTVLRNFMTVGHMRFSRAANQLIKFRLQTDIIVSVFTLLKEIKRLCRHRFTNQSIYTIPITYGSSAVPFNVEEILPQSISSKKIELNKYLLSTFYDLYIKARHNAQRQVQYWRHQDQSTNKINYETVHVDQSKLSNVTDETQKKNSEIKEYQMLPKHTSKYDKGDYKTLNKYTVSTESRSTPVSVEREYSVRDNTIFSGGSVIKESQSLLEENSEYVVDDFNIAALTLNDDTNISTASMRDSYRGQYQHILTDQPQLELKDPIDAKPKSNDETNKISKKLELELSQYPKNDLTSKITNNYEKNLKEVHSVQHYYPRATKNSKYNIKNINIVPLFPNDNVDKNLTASLNLKQYRPSTEDNPNRTKGIFNAIWQEGTVVKEHHSLFVNNLTSPTPGTFIQKLNTIESKSLEQNPLSKAFQPQFVDILKGNSNVLNLNPNNKCVMSREGINQRFPATNSKFASEEIKAMSSDDTIYKKYQPPFVNNTEYAETEIGINALISDSVLKKHQSTHTDHTKLEMPIFFGTSKLHDNQNRLKKVSISDQYNSLFNHCPKYTADLDTFTLNFQNDKRKKEGFKVYKPTANCNSKPADKDYNVVSMKPSPEASSKLHGEHKTEKQNCNLTNSYGEHVQILKNHGNKHTNDFIIPPKCSLIQESKTF
ncbi:hypothetical protein GJ496_009757 [Pomphorhynchus laevis]|nr:hypothetical protein GJ496_009757 [Pomphorhynchus laevis]